MRQKLESEVGYSVNIKYTNPVIHTLALIPGMDTRATR